MKEKTPEEKTLFVPDVRELVKITALNRKEYFLHPPDMAQRVQNALEAVFHDREPKAEEIIDITCTIFRVLEVSKGPYQIYNQIKEIMNATEPQPKN